MSYRLLELTKLENDKKKYKVVLLNEDTGRKKTIKFGQAGASDYTIHKDKERKKLYLKRHRAREDWTKNGIATAGWWSRYLLWNLPTIKSSLDYIIGRFFKVDDGIEGKGSLTYKQQFNKKFGFPLNEPHSLKEISDITGYALEGLKKIQKKGEGAFYSNPQSVRSHIKSATEWGISRVYSAVMKGDAYEMDEQHLYNSDFF